MVKNGHRCGCGGMSGDIRIGKTDKTDAMRKFVVSEERARHGVNIIHTLSAVKFEFKSDRGEKGRKERRRGRRIM